MRRETREALARINQKYLLITLYGRRTSMTFRSGYFWQDAYVRSSYGRKGWTYYLITLTSEIPLDSSISFTTLEDAINYAKTIARLAGRKLYTEQELRARWRDDNCGSHP